MLDLGEEKGIVCLQKKQASKQMNTVSPSEDHIDYEINKRKTQKQDSQAHLGWQSVLKQAWKGCLSFLQQQP